MALSVPAIMKTTAARLSALYLLLFALCAVLLVFYMTSLSARMLTAQTQETINDEVLGLARAYQRGGLPVLVGRARGGPERFRAVIRRASMLALGMMCVGGILIWFLVGRAALKRIDGVSEASRRIMGGNLSGRLPVTGAGDEFDRLSENLN